VPARVFVYCKRSVGDVTAQMLADELRQAGDALANLERL